MPSDLGISTKDATAPHVADEPSQHESLHVEIRSLKASLGALAQENKVIKGSMSWWITRPLRFVTGMFARGRTRSAPQDDGVARNIEVPLTPTESAVAEEPSAPSTILDEYVHEAPAPGLSLDIFKGEWSSTIPGHGHGSAGLFEDGRVRWFEEQLGGYAGKRVLELGPLEGGHTAMMSAAGAAAITSIESNTRAYLKCLVTKELIGYRADFLLGDFVKYLEQGTHEKFDFMLASGVLYHMQEPHRLLELMAGAADNIGVWTHYYDEKLIDEREDLRHKFDVEPLQVTAAGVDVSIYRQKYLSALAWKGFCGGSAETSYWMPWDDIVKILERLGFRVTVHGRSLDHPNGPSVTFFAKRVR